MIRVNNSIAIDENELEISYIRASGPGGQNVNKVSTAAQLRFDAMASPNIPDDIRMKLVNLAGQRATKEGVIIITADRHRTQAMNRADALERLVELIARAANRPKPRKPTRPTKAAKDRRMDVKTRHGQLKKQRGGRNFDD